MPEILRRASGQTTKNYIFYGKSQSTTTPLSVPVKQKPRQNTRKPSKLRVSFKKVPLDPRVPDKAMCIGAEASQEEQVELLAFLDKNIDVFVWSTSDLVGVSRDIIDHRLQVSPSVKPKKQKLHKMLKEKVEAAKADVQRLLDAAFIREVAFPQWLVNIVMVRKKNGK
jgi:hypothetical protein